MKQRIPNAQYPRLFPLHRLLDDPRCHPVRCPDELPRATVGLEEAAEETGGKVKCLSAPAANDTHRVWHHSTMFLHGQGLAQWLCGLLALRCTDDLPQATGGRTRTKKARSSWKGLPALP